MSFKPANDGPLPARRRGQALTRIQVLKAEVSSKRHQDHTDVMV